MIIQLEDQVRNYLGSFIAAKFVNEHEGQVCPASWETGKDTLTPGDELVGKI